MTTQAAQWICPQCGHANRPGSRFCSRCRTLNPAQAGAAPAGPETRRMAPSGPLAASGPDAEIRAAGRMLLATVGTVPPDGLEQWLLLRYQQLPALNTLADQLNTLQIADWPAERAYVADFLLRAGDQLNPAKRYSISFLGRNGLGKSTLVNALLGASYLPEAFREPVTAAVTRVRALRDRPPADELRAQGTTPELAQVRVDYFDEASYLAEVLDEYYRRLNAVPGVTLPPPATLDNNAMVAARNLRNKLRDNPEAAANAATLEGMIESFLRLRGNLPRARWLTYEQARHQINEKEAQGADRDLLRVTREVIYFVDDSMTPDPLLGNSGIELIDLPGLEADVSYHEQTTMRALNEADAVVVVLQARRPSEKNTLAALAELARRKGWSPEYREKFGSKVFIAMNRADEIDLQPNTIQEYFGNNRAGLEDLVRNMVDPVLPNYWTAHPGADRAPFYLVSGYAALFAQQQARRLRGDPLVVSAPVLFPDLKERGELIYSTYEKIGAQLPYTPHPQRDYDLDWLLQVSGVPELKGAMSTFVRTRRFASSLEQAHQGMQDARTRMRNLLTRYIDSRGVRPDQYDRFRQMGTDIQVAWERVDRAAQSLRLGFTEAILATQREFPNRPDPARGDRLTQQLDARVQAIKAKLAESLNRSEDNLRQAAMDGSSSAPRPMRNLEDLISATPDLVNQASILQADRSAQLVLDLRNELDAQFAASAPELASILSDGFEARLKAVTFAAQLKHLAYDQPDLWKRADETLRRLLTELRARYQDMVRTVLLRELVDPVNSVEDERSTLLQALAAAQQPPPPSKGHAPRKGFFGALEGALDQQPAAAAAPAGPPPAFTQTYSLSLMVIETIQVELRRTRDIAVSTAKARALVNQAFGMLSERMKAVAEPLKRLYWLELSRMQDNMPRQDSIQDMVDGVAAEVKRRVVSDPALRQRILSEPDPDEPLRRAVAILDKLDAAASEPLRPDLRTLAEQIATAGDARARS
ncbi:MAG TPA: dynamin family protein [Chloroflexia bacterium]|nr:dynamin family protein [Chloroflexia bacterium]